MEKTADEVANEAIMTRQVSWALIMLVEGLNDEKLFRKFLADPETEIICSWGKENVLGAVDILDDLEVIGFLAIVDADFWHVDDHPPHHENVLVTDEHDLEMMMIRSESFAHFIAEVGSSTKLRLFLDAHGATDIREVLLECALPLGCLRRHSHSLGIGLCFNGLKFSTFVARETLAIDLEKMIESVLSLTRDSSLDLTEEVRRIRGLVANISADPYQLCCGHDLIAILSVGLRKCIGSKSKEAATPEALESALRLSYDSECFRRTQLYQSAQQWSQRNAPYRVFS